MSPVDRLFQPDPIWIIELAPDNRRVMAQVFPAPDGITFADIGWDDIFRSGHPFHEIQGEVVVDGDGFRIGSARIVEVTEDDPLCMEWLNWTAYLRTGQGKWRASREACERAIKMARL